ncbi:cyclase family protein [Paenibacillus doosanensis]|uniref:cyclase family protein n=1 Tax=Paenibacillus doosanensis TaxID=1229154 RepID=UPI0021807438|nr:cyclase family protein [Paenibacillus doosanensis]MCS7464473.1 cyclase family protein [Paenibacillus doosanensis]
MRIIDLSLPIFSGMPVYPGDPEVKVEIAHTYESHTWELRSLAFGSHTGTHVDAVSHMHPGGKTLDELPLDRFFGVSYVVDPRAASFPSRAGLFFREPAGLEVLERVVAAEAPRAGGCLDEPLQRALLQAGIVTYTDLVGLDLLPLNRAFMFYGFPLRIAGGDGSPVRAVAVLE